MRARFKSRFTVSMVAALLLAAAASAQPHERSGRERRGGMQSVADFLELTEEQRAQWDEIEKAQREVMRPTLQELRSLRGNLEEELQAEAPDAEAVGNLMIASRELQRGLEASREETEGQLRGLLDAEQQTKWEAWQAAGGRGPRGSRGARMGRPEGRPGWGDGRSGSSLGAAEPPR
jgi:Spy/CpxP family protein refolding chaperone